MDYKHSIDILTEYTEELKNMLSGISKSKKIPAIELDLLLDKTRNFYDMLLMLRKYSTEVSDEKLSQSLTKESISNDITVESIVKKEPEIQPEKITEKPPKISAKEEIKKEIKEHSEEQKTLSDRFKKQSISLHDSIIQSKQYSDLSTKLQSKPISDITGAIGLNEKFAFIHNLFRGDTGKYNDTMQVLNNATDFNEAYNYLIENFDWDMDSELVQKILELIRRKLIKGKNE